MTPGRRGSPEEPWFVGKVVVAPAHMPGSGEVGREARSPWKLETLERGGVWNKF